MGRTTEDRPYKHYFAHYARQAYPGLGMGREMLSLNLSFSRIVGGPLEAMPGEARQAFKAVAALPPMRYAAPDPDTEPACRPREGLPRDDLLAQPLLHNPILDARPAPARATPDEEREMLRRASHGVTRVLHVLHTTGKRVLTLTEFAARHPGPSPSEHAQRTRLRQPHVRRSPREPGKVEGHALGTPEHTRPSTTVPARRRGQAAESHRGRHTGPPLGGRPGVPAGDPVRAHQSHRRGSHAPSSSR